MAHLGVKEKSDIHRIAGAQKFAVGTYGDATHSVVVTVGPLGAITGLSSTPISGVAPGGAAGGDLSGTYPNPTVAKINGAALGTTTPAAGHVLIGNGFGTSWVSQAISGDATLTAGGSLTIKTINGNTPAVAIYRQTALATVSNITTETSILGTGVGSTTIAANTLKAGSVIRIKVSGIYSAAVTPGNLTVRVKLGTTAIVTATVANLLSSASNLGFEGECLLTFYSIGASAACQPGGNFEYTISAVGGRNFNDLNNTVATTTVNTTTALAVDVTVQWATASASNVIKNATGFVELIL